jgi:hypothetical protein
MGCARYIVYRALSRVNTNTPVKSKGWEGPKDENRNDPEGAIGGDDPKKQENKFTNEGRRRGD